MNAQTYYNELNETEEVKTVEQKLEDLRQLLLSQTIEQLKKNCLELAAANYTANVHIGKKYARLDIGPACNMSGKYMIDMKTGEIYGIKAYGVIHKGHYYGTLDTINQYFWGGYSAARKIS